MWTKRQIIAEAFAELAIAGHVFDLTPDELAWGLRRLDTMIATWVSQGVALPYTQSLGADDSDLDQDAGIPLEAVEAVYLGLAVRLAAGKGKTLANSTKATAKAAFDALLSRNAADAVTEQQLASGTPRGAGRKPWRTVNRPFIPDPNTSPLQGDASGGLIFNSEG